MDMTTTVTTLAKKARDACYSVMALSTTQKNAVLLNLASLLVERQSSIIDANAKDMAAGKAKGLSTAMLDRLRLDAKRIKGMAEAVLDIMRQDDPVGKSIWNTVRPNGLAIERVRVPIGVICIIYEARPNVTTDAFALSFKSGNTVILRGGSESINSNLALSGIIQMALKRNGVSAEACSYVPVTEREALVELVKLNEYIDLVIPRGGEGLIRMVTENSRVPVIKHYKGVCHVYVDADADVEMAKRIVVNAKVQRPGVCNSAETLLLHKDFKGKKDVLQALVDQKVEIRTDGSLDAASLGMTGSFSSADPENWVNEYLDLRMNAKVVNSLEEAISHINTLGSHHSDSIVTNDEKAGQKFLHEVDSAAVYVNASTRFTDGGEFGFGAEIGISTDKLHSRGPMGAEDLTTYKYVVRGNGQVRG